MKKSVVSFLTLVMLMTLLSVAPVSAQSKYTGGLLDGVQLNVGPAVGTLGKTSTKMTDNNESTEENKGNVVVWHSFATPQEISAVIVNGSENQTVEFYDAGQNLLSSYTKINSQTGVQSLETPVKNVSMVVLRGSGIWVKEFNVFSKPSTPPSATRIDWIQAGDKVVSLDWANVGAKSYDVKRSTSSGGPYSTIVASDVTGTTYTDNTVNNGTTYYYIVVAKNEAGGIDSPQRFIKPTATKYTGGLLDGITLSVGSKIGESQLKSKKMTDNDETSEENKGHGAVWHTFATPQEISAVIFNGSDNQTVEFYDVNQNLLSTYTKINNQTGIQSLETPVKNVSMVVLRGSGIWVKEFNVFGQPSTPPSATRIDWIQAGDKAVSLDWVHVGAKSYDVRRGTSSGGPYSTLVASDVKGLTFIDTTVNNDTMYYYVVVAKNEAGRTESPEAPIKPTATKYTGGLLDMLPIKIGTKYGEVKSTSKKMTDNNIKTEDNVGGGMGWYTFNSPKEISSVIANGSTGLVVEFYDKDDNLLYTHKVSLNDKVETLPSPVKNVQTVMIRGMWVKEWNVFGKSELPPTEAPMNLIATAGDAQVTLNWDSVKGATKYNVKRATTAGGAYTTVASVDGTKTSYIDKGLTNGTTYYYVVTAVGQAGESTNSNEASATPKAGVVEPEPKPEPTPDPDPNQGKDMGDRAILTLTLDNGTEKEYDLSMTEVNAFLTWYDARAEGKGKLTFAFDKHDNNRGPFKKRKEYIKFDSIYNFEVNGYETGAGNEGTEKPQPQPEPTPIPEEELH
ncbi:fibronectin type III domain-containing protein [Paenibacillus arenosi]